MRIIIIGSGLAGQLVIRELREKNNKANIKMFTSCQGGFYSKPSLSNIWTQGKKPSDLVLYSAEDIKEAYNCDIYENTNVIRIDRDNQQIETTSGMFEYDKLVMAIGAKPIEPPWLKISKHVFRVNQLEDYDKFYPVINKDNHIAIIGGGLIGVEFAHDIAPYCKKVTLIEKLPSLMATMLPKEIGDALAERLSSRGVEVLTGVSVSTIEEKPSGVEVLTDKSTYTFNAVLGAIGIRPNIALAQLAGLEVNIGIKVDSFGKTSDENIYALGDCAEVCGIVKSYVAPLKLCASVVADQLTGGGMRITYPPLPVMLKTPTYPVCFCYLKAPDEWEVEVTEEGIEALAYKDGQLVAYALTEKMLRKRMQHKKVMTNWLDAG